ncbi:ParA family protein [Lysinibacillus antri]|uniref:ParA family protein n=1 Tax=Lysinibacillus antri TaxID=2498145 RepID=A0A3S0RGP1_9BACI|nr:ParA family protein [Lysinibacillus antri]RUL46527.1 ParA family protein [Lysinibacillus antri]
MTATVISFSLQKGGVGKTTTCGLTAYLLAKRGYKVLAIDMDSQGNLTQLISGYDDLEVFYQQTIREAMVDGDVTDYIKVATDNLHYVPADDYLVLIADHRSKTPRTQFLKEAISSIKEDYDFILIDTPPNLSMQTVNALMASNYVVMLFETAKFSYNAIPRFMDAVDGAIDSGNPNLKIAGILATLTDARRTDSKELVELVREEYEDLIFNTVISRRAAIGRLSVYGINDNPEIKAATEQHESYVEELLERVNKK